MKEKKTDYRKGDSLEDGSEIVHIYGATEQLIVAQTGPNSFSWEFADAYENPNLTKLLSVRRQVWTRIHSCVLFDKQKEQPMHNLAHAFYISLRNSDDAAAVERFRDSKNQILSDLCFHLRIAALTTALITGTIIYIVLHCCTSPNDFLYWAISAGLLGVFLSILFSNSRIKATDNSSMIRQCVDTFVRMLYGICCGLAAYILAKANVVGSVFANEQYGLMTFTMVAGFSERFIPDFMEKLPMSES